MFQHLYNRRLGINYYAQSKGLALHQLFFEERLLLLCTCTKGPGQVSTTLFCWSYSENISKISLYELQRTGCFHLCVDYRLVKYLHSQRLYLEKRSSNKLSQERRQSVALNWELLPETTYTYLLVSRPIALQGLLPTAHCVRSRFSSIPSLRSVSWNSQQRSLLTVVHSLRTLRVITNPRYKQSLWKRTSDLKVLNDLK